MNHLKHRLGKLLLLITVVAFAAACVQADEFSALRLKWRGMLTQGTNASRADPLYSNWVSQVEFTAQSYLNTLDTSVGRTNLFNSYRNLATDSSDITTTYERLEAIALGYAVPGSALEGNATLLTNLIGGLDWMHAHYYNATTSVYDNWYDFEIAVPRALNNIVVLIYSNLAPAQISNHMAGIEHFSPTPDDTTILSPVTAYNKVWKSLVVSLRGVIVQDSAKIAMARDALSEVFTNVTSGDGFYADGSFVFHDDIPYNTGYGVGLLDTTGLMLQLLQDSAWPITDPARTNVFRWIHDGYEPFLVRGASMELVDGRYHTRNGDSHERGHSLLGAILRVAQVAPPAEAAAIHSFVKAAIQSDTSRRFVDNQAPPYSLWANAILNDSNVVPLVDVPWHRQFPSMDRVVHHLPDWTFGLAMSSKRIANYESTRGENLKGWFTGEGMTYLYNNDITHYSDDFWSTVDPYRLPGTSVDILTRTNSSGDAYNSPNNHVGGASILGLYGVAVMHLNAYGSDTMSARNSWFLFDNEIVCVGNSLSSIYGRETIVENRRLGVYGNNPFTVNGTAKPTGPGWSETLAATTWAHLAGSSPGADIGYYFPSATAVKALRESRSGRFFDINSTYGSRTPSTRHYLTMYLDHGTSGSSASYAYVLLPGFTAARVAAYAANPEIAVLQNNNTATAVRKAGLGLTAVNFWRDTSNFVAGVGADHKAAVILRNDGNVLDVGMSDPTQTNQVGLRIELFTPALSVLSVDPGVSVLQLAPTVKLLVNTSNRYGATLGARFLLNATGQKPSVKLSSPCDGNMDAPATVTLSADARDADGTIARLDFFNGTTRFLQLFAPTSNVTTVTVPDLPLGTHSFSVVAVDTAGLMATSGPVMISVHTPKAPGQGSGLIAEYFKDSAEYRVLTMTRTDTNINFSWPDYLSHPIPTAPHFCVRWAGKLQAQRSGLHRFHTETDEGVRLWIDGRLIIDNWNRHRLTEDVASLSLVAGRYYELRMEYYEDSEPAVARLYWTPPGGSREIIPQSQLYPADRGLRATYFYGTNPTNGFPLWLRVDDTVNFAWGTNSPEPSILGLPFSARWVGKVKANADGGYHFFTSSDEGVRLYVNGQLVINNWTAHTLTEDAGSISLPVPGQYYDLVLEYYNLTGTGTVVLSWLPPGESKQVIPSANLTPHQNNNPPVLSPIANVAGAQEALLTFTSSATDPDGPGQSFSFSLDAGAPTGATIHATSGVFTWTPSPRQPGGQYPITVRVTDFGTPAMSDAQTFLVTIPNLPNIAPTVSPVPDQTTLEDTATAPLALTVGDAETAAGELTVSALSSNPGLVPTENVIFGGTGSNRTVVLLPATNQFGTALITLLATDGLATQSISFALSVTPVNDPPTLDPLSNITLVANSGPLNFSLTGITAGPANEQQALTVVAIVDAPGLLADPVVTYQSPDTNGSLLLTPFPNAAGTSDVTVIVFDTGGVEGGGIDTVTRSFQLVLPPVADVAVSSIAAFQEGHLQVIVTVTNLGPNPATHVSLTNLLPAGAFLLSILSEGADCVSTGDLVRCSFPSIPANASTTVTLVLGVEPLARFTNRSEVAAFDLDPVSSNNVALTVIPLGGTQDFDGDGLPDVWELDHQLDARVADGDLDPDGDGLSNRQEYIAGTDPRDPASALRITAIMTGQGNELTTLSFLAVSNRTYSILASTNVTAGPWEPLTNLTAATTGILSVTHHTRPGPFRVYRILTGP